MANPAGFLFCSSDEIDRESVTFLAFQLVWILLLVLRLTFQEPVTEFEPKTLHILIMLESQ
jgi:hypothetical protein